MRMNPWKGILQDQERNKSPFENTLVFNPQLVAYKVKVYCGAHAIKFRSHSSRES